MGICRPADEQALMTRHADATGTLLAIPFLVPLRRFRSLVILRTAHLTVAGLVHRLRYLLSTSRSCSSVGQPPRSETRTGVLLLAPLPPCLMCSHLRWDIFILRVGCTIRRQTISTFGCGASTAASRSGRTVHAHLLGQVRLEPSNTEQAKLLSSHAANVAPRVTSCSTPPTSRNNDRWPMCKYPRRTWPCLKQAHACCVLKARPVGVAYSLVRLRPIDANTSDGAHKRRAVCNPLLVSRSPRTQQLSRAYRASSSIAALHPTMCTAVVTSRHPPCV